MINFPKKPFDLFIDVGLSYNAPHSVEILKQNKNAFVIGIEPNPKNCHSVRSLNLGERFHLIEAGASDVEEELVLNMMWPDPGTSSFLEPTDILLSQNYKIEHKVKIKTLKLKKILDQVDWNFVNDNLFSMKSDTQGFELKVLKGLENYISKIKNLQMECTTWGQYENACDFNEIIHYLSAYMILEKQEHENAWFTKK